MEQQHTYAWCTDHFIFRQLLTWHPT